MEAADAFGQSEEAAGNIKAGGEANFSVLNFVSVRVEQGDFERLGRIGADQPALNDQKVFFFWYR
ncbi:hypothetical protein [Allobaculum sp. Allo2]|uniref:hypothetical protein n=1 Tax=Allobaculum sp. Allo2 TaxID=2853432 RepID=UPI001F6207BD|nr:hypothetical protein [Allobaculum sp. Allo2]UNT94376.1 hypothetical protein KWG61_07310 [Allobaculum sp. Allo2]